MKKKANRNKDSSIEMWSDGVVEDESPHILRWSREAKKNSFKKNKQKYSFSGKTRGMIYVVNRRTYGIVTPEEEIFKCELPPNLDITELKQLAVGDEVEFSGGTGKYGMISQVFPRKNKISRLGPKNRRNKELMIASNIDLVVVVFSVVNPDFNVRFLDRFLIRFEELEIPVLICVNKMDLAKQEPIELDYLRGIGYEVATCSVLEKESMDYLRDRFRGKKSVFVGPSGVGKSSLLREIVCNDSIKVGNLRNKGGKGRHTTSRSQFYCLEKSTWVMDSPGIRELSLQYKEPRDLSRCFREFTSFAKGCSFRNCSHLKEEGCKIKEGVKEGAISEFRYYSYISILTKGDERSGY